MNNGTNRTSPFGNHAPNPVRSSSTELFPVIAGSEGSLSIPLQDVETSGTPELVIGPGFYKNNVRFFARMPSVETIKGLPAIPPGSDLKSVTFDVVRIVLFSAMQPTVSAKVLWVSTAKGHGKVASLHMDEWKGKKESSNRASTEVECPPLLPGDWISFEMASSTKTKRAKKNKTFTWMPEITPIPTEAEVRKIPIELSLVVKAKWIPEARESGLEIVDGDPLARGTTSPSEVVPIRLPWDKDQRPGSRSWKASPSSPEIKLPWSREPKLPSNSKS